VSQVVIKVNNIAALLDLLSQLHYRRKLPFQ